MAENKDEYNLYTEKIIAKPWFKHKKTVQLIKIALLAIFAGGIAGFTFLAVISIGYSKINTEVRKEITIPMDEYAGVSANKVIDNKGQLPEDAEFALNRQQNGEELEEKDKNIYDYVDNVVEKVSPSLVTVTAIVENEDPLFAITQEKADYPGVIVADNGLEYIVLTDYQVSTVGSLEVKFFNAINVKAQLLLADPTTNIAVVAVRHSNVPLSTRTEIKMVDMGNSYMLNRGEMVIVMGDLYGIKDAYDFGMVVSTGEKIYEADSKHGLIYTNINGFTGGRGFVFNEDGQLVGIVHDSLSVNNLVAYGISDIKIRIQNISNQKPIGYLGIIGRDIASEVAESYDMPMGAFVESVEMDSPAYFAGIFTGDIITDIGGRTISNVYNIERTMCEFEPGTEVVVTVYRYAKGGYVPIEYTVVLK